MLIRRRVQALLTALICLGVAGVAAAAATIGSGTVHPKRAAWSAPTHATRPGLEPSRPNIVFVLTDDLSMNLLRYMPHVQAMERGGLTFNDYFVSDSLCCPSRSSIFTGRFPHDTHVFSNFGPGGGFNAFYSRGEDRHTFAVALKRAGYRTAMTGKYLNGYLAGFGEGTDGSPSDAPASYVPPGWSQWDVVGWGYPEFNYWMNEDGGLQQYGNQPSDYLTDVIAQKGVSFINRSVAAHKPFFLELATFAPHTPYTPAPRDATAFTGLQAPRPPSFDVPPANPPFWLAGHPPLTPEQITQIDTAFRLRVQSVQAVDSMIGSVERTLVANGVRGNTYLVFSSDNGLHAGEYRLMPGKLTAFDTDIRVPLVVDGPGVPAGARTNAIAENIDLAKTFTAIGGTNLSGDGHSLLSLFGAGTPASWRNAALVEHHGPGLSVSDPDYQASPSGSPPTYEAMRTHDFLYVEYKDGEREFYDLRSDPFELDNIAWTLPTAALALLHKELRAIAGCHGESRCWAAMHVAPFRWTSRSRPAPGSGRPARIAPK